MDKSKAFPRGLMIEIIFSLVPIHCTFLVTTQPCVMHTSETILVIIMLRRKFLGNNRASDPKGLGHQMSGAITL
jgi:hypothetical protein